MQKPFLPQRAAGTGARAARDLDVMLASVDLGFVHDEGLERCLARARAPGRRSNDAALWRAGGSTFRSATKGLLVVVVLPLDDARRRGADAHSVQPAGTVHHSAHHARRAKSRCRAGAGHLAARSRIRLARISRSIETATSVRRVARGPRDGPDSPRPACRVCCSETPITALFEKLVDARAAMSSPGCRSIDHSALVTDGRNAQWRRGDQSRSSYRLPAGHCQRRSKHLRRSQMRSRRREPGRTRTAAAAPHADHPADPLRRTRPRRWPPGGCLPPASPSVSSALERNAERLANGERLQYEPSRGQDEIGSLDLTLRRASLRLRTRERELRAMSTPGSNARSTSRRSSIASSRRSATRSRTTCAPRCAASTASRRRFARTGATNSTKLHKIICRGFEMPRNGWAS